MDHNENLADAATEPDDGIEAWSGVRCSFECNQDPWHVRHAVVHEALARPYRINLSLLSDNLDLNTDELVGSTCRFTFENVANTRHFHGVIQRVHARGRTIVRGAQEVVTADVEVVPALAMLAQRINCRIFQDMTVPEILRDVLGLRQPSAVRTEGLAAYGRTLDDGALSDDDYEPPRDYCVQYKESDLDFATRLLHEEGIVYIFDQTERDREILRFIDREDGLPWLKSTPGFRLPVNREVDEDTDAITHFVVERTSSPARYETMHYSWFTPADKIRSSGMAVARGEVADNNREIFLPRERRIREVYAKAEIIKKHDDSQRYLAIALQEIMADDFIGRGFSKMYDLGAGMRFEVDHESASESMVALEVVHQISMDGDTANVPGIYNNQFVCVPSSRFRTLLIGSSRPIMRGPQTATVTGPPNEDIYTDRFGRIKILMHWDRETEGHAPRRQTDPTPTSSAWVRVVQAWAGNGWGTLFIPRVGMEVLVDFLDGNPDRPVVVGCLYNGNNQPPYSLPEQCSRSTIRTKSTPYNGGHNELRFEDAANAEEIYLHGQKDWAIEIENDKNQSVGCDESLEVGNDRSKKVDHDEKWQIGNDQTGRVNNDQTLTVGNNQRSTIQGNRIDAIAKNADETVGGSKSLLIQENMTQMVNEDMKIVVGGSMVTVVTEDYSLIVHGNVLIKAATSMTFKCGDASITLNSNGEIVIQGSKVDVA